MKLLSESRTNKSTFINIYLNQNSQYLIFAEAETINKVRQHLYKKTELVVNLKLLCGSGMQKKQIGWEEAALDIYLAFIPEVGILTIN